MRRVSDSFYTARCQHNKMILTPVGLTLACLVLASTDVSADITLEPACVTLFSKVSHTHLKVTCTAPNDTKADNVSEITIQRHLSKHKKPMDLASANVAKYNGTVVVLSNLTVVNASGSIEEGRITLHLHPPTSCQEHATYTCRVGYVNGSDYHEETQKLEYVRPGDVTVTSSGDVIDIGMTLEMKCESLIGGELDGAELTWKWQYQVCDGGPYRDYEQETDIDTGPVTRDTQSPCQRRQVSRLNRTLTADDEGRTYRCFVRRDGIDFIEQAAYHNVGNFTGEEKTTQTPPTESSGNSDLLPTWGWIVVVIGSLFLIVIIVGGVVLYCKRRRR